MIFLAKGQLDFGQLTERQRTLKRESNAWLLPSTVRSHWLISGALIRVMLAKMDVCPEWKGYHVEAVKIMSY
jgi:hypothetical protein